MNQIEDIIALVKAGYTKAEISALLTPAEAPAPTPTIQPEPVAEEVAAPEEVKTEVPAAPVNPDLSALLAEVKQLRAAVQASNLRADSLPTMTREDIATKILGEVINPTQK